MSSLDVKLGFLALGLEPGMICASWVETSETKPCHANSTVRRTLFLHEEKDDAGKEVCVVCCVLCVVCWGGGQHSCFSCTEPQGAWGQVHSHRFKHVTKSSRTDSNTCPQPHAPSPMPHASGGMGPSWSRVPPFPCHAPSPRGHGAHDLSRFWVLFRV